MISWLRECKHFINEDSEPNFVILIRLFYSATKLGDGIEWNWIPLFCLSCASQFCCNMLLYLSQNWVPIWGKERFLWVFTFPSFIFKTWVVIAWHSASLKFSLTNGFGIRTRHGQKEMGKVLEGSPPGLRIRLSSVFVQPRHQAFLEHNGLCFIIVFWVRE